MAMVRTMFSPRCWATSSTRRNGLPVFWSTFSVSRAFRMPGRAPSNSTSTTAPMTCAMRPFEATIFSCLLIAVTFGVRVSSERFGAGDDLDQLFGDLSLARAVVLERQRADHVASVARGVVHRLHLRAVEAGLVL